MIGAVRRSGLGAAVLAVVAGACPAAPLPGPPLPPERPRDLLAARPPPPLPPVRPRDLPAPPPEASGPSPQSPPPEPAPADAAGQQACAALLAGGHVVARPVPAVTGPAGCGMAAPVELSAVLLPSGGRVDLRPPAEVACPVAAALADWVRDDLAPAFAAAGRSLRALSGTSGYACRPRDGLAGAKLSEHATGNAVDVGGFETADGGTVAVDDPGPASILLTEVRQTACARFTTVLGPGSDSYHLHHMHVDLRTRRDGYRICQWASP